MCYILEESAATRFKAMAVFEPDGRPKWLLMKFPADMTFAKSTLVFIPSPWSMYTTSSVATFPVAPLAYGHPPKPATEESIVLIPICSKKKKKTKALVKSSEKMLQACKIICAVHRKINFQSGKKYFLSNLESHSKQTQNSTSNSCLTWRDMRIFGRDCP